MKIMKIALVVFVCLVAICIALYAYYGGFYKPTIQMAEQGGETVVYNEVVGDYSQSGVVMDQIYTLLKEEYKIETFKGFGIYYDNPKMVEKSKLRSDIGCILEPADVEKVSTLKGNTKTKVLPKKQYLVTEFPYKGKMSVMMSLMKVYPALSKYAEDNAIAGAGAVMEIYDVPNKKILYRQEIK